MSHLLAVAPMLPQHRYSQAELTEALVPMIGGGPTIERALRRIHAGCGVDFRHLALPLEQYGHLVDFGQANDAFITAAVDLGARALTLALDRARVSAVEVDIIVSTTITGLAVPSLEARIAERVGLRSDVLRLPLVGLGCMAGAASIARLHDLLTGRPEAVGAMVSVELCSLTVQRGDTSGANLVASGLFGDGAGAVVASGSAHRHIPHPANAHRPGAPPMRTRPDPPMSAPRVVASASRLYPGTAEVMGWDVGASGLRVVLGPQVPDLVRAHVGPDVAAFLQHHGLGIEEVGWWVCHPGGPKVIDSLAHTLNLPHQALELTTESLRTVGNLSSASVLHILRTALDRDPPAGSFGVMMAMGPGFSLELLLLEA